jgi:glycosyltransferase involved in cell wall biosynthesis
MVISIITINKNNRQGLLNTLQSVIGQNFEDYELIVIDGASTDGSKEIIASFSSKINYWVSEKDAGVYQAMNKGIEIAKGKYCLFLNSGDTLNDVNSLSYLSKTENDEDVIFGNIEQDGTTVIFPDIITLYNLRWGTLPHPGTLIKRHLFNLIGRYNEQYKIASDWEFWLKALIIKDCSYRHIDCTIAKVEQAGISATTNFDEGYKILYSLFPKRILDDYNKFKEIGSEENYKIFNWLAGNRVVFRFIKLIYRYSRKTKW